MKTKRSVAKKRRQIELAKASAPLKADEVIDLLEKSYMDSSRLLNAVIGSAVSVILFLEEVLLEGGDFTNRTLILRLKDREVDYTSAAGAVSEILATVPGPLYEAKEQVDKGALAASAAVRSYRQQHPKPATA